MSAFKSANPHFSNGRANQTVGEVPGFLDSAQVLWCLYNFATSQVVYQSQHIALINHAGEETL